jgi:hypothetical protein
MALLSAREAARRLSKDERTIRRWIRAGKLTPRQSASNRLAIDEGEIERLAARLTQEDQVKRQALTDLEARISQLEQEQAAILARLALLENRTPAVARPAASDTRTPRASRPRLFADETPSDIPPGSRRATEFGEAHGFNRVTFYDHMTRVQGERVEHLAMQNPNKPRETIRWLTPEQQRGAVNWWEKHNKPWRRCDNPACLVCGSGGQQAEQDYHADAPTSP